MLTVSLYTLQIFDRVFASHSYDTLIYLTFIAVFAISILAFLDYLRGRILLFISHWLDEKVSPEALLRGVDNLLQGKGYAAQSLKDIASIRSFLSSYGVLAIFDAPWVPIYIFVIFLLYPILGVVSLIGAIILFLLALVNEKITRQISLEVNDGVLKAQNQITATLRNAESIQAMGMLPDIIKKWFNENEKVLNLQTILNRRSGILLAISKFSRLAIQIVILALGAYFVINNKLTSGQMIAASIILSRALAPIEQSIAVWGQFMSVRQAYHRLNAYLEAPMVHASDTILPEPKGLLTVEKLNFIVPDTSTYLLRGIQFFLQPGEMLSVIGPSGAGKTTLARLIVGVWPPSSGHVRLDNADVFTWNREEIGHYIGYLPQSIELFSGTVKDNIARMQIEVKDEEVIRAGQNAFVHDMILRLPNGYDTIIKEAGMNLSAGQRQRIALARALYGNPKLIVLDEPNSNLDEEGEKALENCILAAKQRNCTVVVIAHTPTLLNLSTKLLLLQEGQMIALGPTQETLEKLHALMEKRLGKPQEETKDEPPKETKL